MTGSPLPPDPYTALGLVKDATLDQIRGAHRKLVLKTHPDRFCNATPEEKQKKSDEFHKVQAAYELLSDENERKKYDASVRLMEMRAEVMKERETGGSSRKQHHSRSQPGSGDFSSGNVFTVPIYETRGEAIYEERVPRSTAKKHEDDFAHAHAHFETSAKYAESSYRSSPRSRAEEFRGTPRRSSGRDWYEEERRANDDAYQEKVREKAQQKADKEELRKEQAASKKARDKSRKQDVEAKTYYQSPKVEQYSDNDSVEEFMSKYSTRRHKSESSSKKRPEEIRRSTRSRRPAETELSDSDDPHFDKFYSRRTDDQERKAREHMGLGRNRNSSDADDHARGGRKLPKAPSPPPLLSKEKIDTAKRSSGRKTRDPSPMERRKDSKPIEIVEEAKPRRNAYDSGSRRPSLKPFDTAPVGGESDFHMGPKARTFDVPPKDRSGEPAAPRRSKTTNLEQMASSRSGRDRDRTPPETSSRSRRTKDFSSPIIDGRDEYVTESPAANWTRYQIFDPSDDEDSTKPRTVLIDPTGSNRRSSRPRGHDRTNSRDLSPSGANASVRRSGTTASRSMRDAGLGLGIGIQRASTFQGPDGSDRFRSGKGDSSPISPRIGIQRSSTANVVSSAGAEGSLPFEIRPSLTRSGSSMRGYSRDDISFSPSINLANVKYSDRPRGERTDSGASTSRLREREASDREVKYRDPDSGRESGRERRDRDRDGGSRRERRTAEAYVTRDREGHLARHGSSRMQSVRT